MLDLSEYKNVVVKISNQIEVSPEHVLIGHVLAPDNTSKWIYGIPKKWEYIELYAPIDNILSEGAQVVQVLFDPRRHEALYILRREIS